MRIGLDFDDVVADSGTALIEMYNKKYGVHFEKNDFKSYLFEETWGGSREERVKEIDAFFATDQLKKIYPVAGSVAAIGALKSRGHDLYIVTGRSSRDIEQTELWIEQHFPRVFREVHYSNFRVSDKKRKKSEICQELGIEVFIDDNPDHALDCATVCAKVLLLDQPWNRHQELPKNVERVFSWDEIVTKLGR
jgi:uncharacterized HAD superfamily protein